MNYEDVQKVSNAAKAKSNLVNTNFSSTLYVRSWRDFLLMWP